MQRLLSLYLEISDCSTLPGTWIISIGLRMGRQDANGDYADQFMYLPHCLLLDRCGDGRGLQILI